MVSPSLAPNVDYSSSNDASTRYVLFIQKQNAEKRTSGTISHEKLQEDIHRGVAVIKTMGELRALDASLRRHVRSREGFPTFVTPTESLQHFFQAVLETPQAVNSEAFAEFLSIQKKEDGDHHPDNSTAKSDSEESRDFTEPTLQYIQYLLPNIQTPTFQPLPRFGSYQRDVHTFLPGWWLVWYLKVDVPVDFYVFATGADGTLEQVHHANIGGGGAAAAAVGVGANEQAPHFGSYRVMSEPTRAVLQVKAQSVMQSGRLLLEYAAIPHDAFTAACTAAKDATTCAHRKQTAPMLSLILDHSEPVTVVVQEWIETDDDDDDDDDDGNKEEPAMPVDEGLNDDSTCLSVAQLATLSDRVVELQESNNLLEQERSALLEELNTSQDRVETLSQKVQQADSERRVWNLVRTELNAELSRLSVDLQLAREEKTAAVHELLEARQELQEQRGQVKLLEAVQRCDGDDENGAINNNQASALVQVIRRLERDLQVEKDKVVELQKSMAEMEALADEEVARARGDARDAEAERRSLASQMRQLQQQQRGRHRGGDDSKPPLAPPRKLPAGRDLDPAVLAYAHPDPRLNEQLSTLRDRHSKLNALLAQNPNNSKNAEILGMLEKAIHDLVDKG